MAQRLLRMRRRPSAFDPNRIIEAAKLQEIKELCMRAPSSFNSQPFRCVLVQSDEAKDELAHVMASPANAKRVLQAPLTAVFLADKLSYNNPQLTSEDQSPGLTYQQRKRKANNLAFINGSYGSTFRKAVENISTWTPIQIPEHPTVWAVKQTIFFVDHWMIACADLGLSTWGMEGFDEARVRSVVGASDRYHCPVVVCTGYSKDPEGDLKKEESPRLNPDDIFVDDKL